MALQSTSNEAVKRPAVAGLFYPADVDQLEHDVDQYLAESTPRESCTPKALIVPHAGYVYSGPIAASAYRQLAPLRNRIKRVLLLGPAHRVAFQGIAAHGAEFFSSPLGKVPVDTAFVSALANLSFVHLLDQAFAQEHCLEVQLPFLQRSLKDFLLVPLLVGQADYQQVFQVMQRVIDDPETLILVSSDLSHYHSYAEAKLLDEEASRNIADLNPDGLKHDHACGRIPVGGLLLAAKQQGWQPLVLDLRNSGDTAGSRDQVVGYGAYAFV